MEGQGPVRLKLRETDAPCLDPEQFTIFLPSMQDLPVEDARADVDRVSSSYGEVGELHRKLHQALPLPSPD